ncbi:MAG TPA: DUF2169 domain-containing protein [Thermoanaerobaculia bacterium]|nr:DUF2169 domain-containing protein [Thermoanaerobaculia bacterium]HQN08633.1 DUF2169 domain-containing protein [Thermoanaerobaculia bacterium]HQP84933.1 DUF2169 domain-containing protein [Thermoanaerobaculia bacterium]
MDLVNRSPFAAERALVLDESGAETLAVLLKASFVWAPRTGLAPAPEQVPVRLADEHLGEPGRSSVLRASDLCPGKPGCDLVLLGSAGRSRPAPQVDVSFRVGAWGRELRVFGERRWSGSAGVPDASPFESIDLTWENAFGGRDEDVPPGEPWEEELRNPVGRGFRARKSRRPVSGDLLPSIEDPAEPIRGPLDRPAPAGVGFVAPHWEPRRSRAGTYDEAWQRGRAPLPPEDFDPRSRQRGASGLVAPEAPAAGAPVVVTGVRPHGEVRFALPRVVPSGAIYFRTKKSDLSFALQTVLFDANASLLELTFGAYQSVHGQTRDVECVAVEAEAS